MVTFWYGAVWASSMSLGRRRSGGEVPDGVVVEAEFFDDRFEACVAFEVELDLDRDSFRAGEDGVGEVGRNGRF